MPKTVLIVDDNELLRTTLSVLLTGQLDTVSVVEAANGAEAIVKAEAHLPDLIILDIAMPVMNGVLAAPTLKKIAPKAPILLFTLYAAEVREPYRFGVDAIVAKAEGADTFLRTVRELLASQTAPITPTAAASAAPPTSAT